MSAWQEINKIFEDADKIKALEELYMERGNVTTEEAFQLALEKWNSLKETNEHPH